MSINTELTANEIRAALILVGECLSGMGGDRPADLGGDEYTWINAKMLMAHGYTAASANATIGALMAKGFVEEYDKNELVLSTPAWQFLDTVWDNKEVLMTTKTNSKKTAKSTPAGRKAKREAAVKAAPDTITICKHTADGSHVYVEAASGDRFARPRNGDGKEFRALSKIGMSYSKALAFHNANPAPKPQARLAKGVDSHNSPHAAKAVADQRKDAPAAKASPKTAKAPKAEKNKQPSRGAERSYTVVKGTENKARPDSWRHHMTTMIVSHTDTASAKAAHAKSKKFSGNKLDFNWAATNQFIKFAK